jgi:hypothetical protein
VVRAILDRADVADLRLVDPPLEELVAGFYEGPAGARTGRAERA